MTPRVVAVVGRGTVVQVEEREEGMVGKAGARAEGSGGGEVREWRRRG
ncbi:MAG: hypothetical protein ACK55Z_03545 [bacterium]